MFLFGVSRPVKSRCRVCGVESVLVSSAIGVCADCLRRGDDGVLEYALEAHASARGKYGLPSTPPRSPGGLPCKLCSNECVIGEGEVGYCGLRRNVDGRLVSLSSQSHGLLHYYNDPHPTNCCSAWFCPATTGAGYPRYAVYKGLERGYDNLAVFFYGCNFNCLFCQNASHKNLEEGWRLGVDEFASRVENDRRITCICYFGGSPEPQLPFAIEASRQALERCRNRVLRICWEWNGCGNPELVRRAAELSYRTGGNVKFDLKAYTPSIAVALSGVPNRRAYENFELVYREFYEERKNIPVLTATTLLVPGYVDATEVENIARFIADLNPNIPYSLLAFHPDWLMMDMPITPRKQAMECYEAAKKHLKNVNIGNKHLLSIAP